MGLFSWNCKGCDHSIRHPGVCRSASRWMAEAVVLQPNGTVLRGTYDGYGRVAGHDVHNQGEPEMYHNVCWSLSGSPPHFTSASKSADDQGHFVGEYDPKQPTQVDDLTKLKRHAAKEAEKLKKFYARFNAKPKSKKPKASAKRSKPKRSRPVAKAKN